MKKWMILKIALLFLTIIFVEMPSAPEQYRLEFLDQAFQKEKEICQEFKENNTLIKRYIFVMLALTNPDENKCIKIGELIASIEKADKLITESQKDLQKDIPYESAFEKLDVIKNNLKEANALHKKVLNGLAALLPPSPKPLPLTET